MSRFGCELTTRAHQRGRRRDSKPNVDPEDATPVGETEWVRGEAHEEKQAQAQEVRGKEELVHNGFDQLDAYRMMLQYDSSHHHRH